MTATPAVETAGGSVLPADIERWNDIVTCTLPGDGMQYDEQFGRQSGYYALMYLDRSGDLHADRVYRSGVSEIADRYGRIYPKVHVYRPHREDEPPVVLDNYDFFQQEVRTSLTHNPWMRHQWYKDNFLRWVELLPRASETVAGAVSYFQNRDKRVRNVRTPIKPGRFLKKFFGDILTEAEIHTYALEWDVANKHREVKITQDADEIETVYRKAYLGSCMQFSSGHWSGSCHPARVYAGPDLGIAYIGAKDDAAARVLVWPEKKIFFRKTYGDGPRLTAALKQSGYSEANSDAFEGARLRRIESRDTFVMPYLDVSDEAYDDGEFIRVGDGDLQCQYTNGLCTYKEPSYEYHCDRCGDGIEDDDDRIYIESTEQDVCDTCCNRYYFHCNGSGYYYENSQRAATETNHDGTYSLEHVRDNSDWFQCFSDNVYYLKSEHDHIIDDVGYCYRQSYAEDNGFYCAYSEEWFVDMDDEHRIELTNGTSVNMRRFTSEDEFQQYLKTTETAVKEPPCSETPDLLATEEQEAA